ncbi:type IV secretory system conjugative DNA transfer family protein, partial [Streptomyces sp. NPDC059874]|uniref:type IV secretory system conjugative DNA transfer family protein n=1 Tax=Streptomyces sp. NPDC059874 TaxID=3346983 RepID=UPI0036605BBB
MGSDVLLGHEDGTPVYLRYDHRTAHLAVLGKSRFGKTTLLEHLVLQDMRDHTAAIVIDAHGDLSKRLVSLAPTGAQDALVLVEPNAERPFGLNLYERAGHTSPEAISRTVGNVLAIFLRLMGAEGRGLLPVIDQGLRSTARVLIANDFTMAELPLLYMDAAFRSRALAKVNNPAVLQYWRDYEETTPRGRQDTRNPVLNKASRFLEDDLIRLMVSQQRSTIPFEQIMEGGGTLLFNLAGLDRESVSFLGMVFLSVLNDLLHQRERITAKDRKRVHLYLDEYGRFATSTTRHMLEECAKYGLGATLAHQSLSQTPEQEALKVETLISFQLSGEDARLVAQQLDVSPVRMKKRLKQRMEPQYDEWEEEVWDTAANRDEHKRLQEKEKEVFRRVGGGADSYVKARVEAQHFHETHCRIEHHQEHCGELPARNRSGTPWYDFVEESDQSHADRREELVTTLVTLPRHLAYCKIPDSSGVPREYKVSTLEPARTGDIKFRTLLRMSRTVKTEPFDRDT